MQLARAAAGSGHRGTTKVVLRTHDAGLAASRPHCYSSGHRRSLTLRALRIADISQHAAEEGRYLLSGTTDKAKGGLKEAAGTLTSDNTLRREGKLDQARGRMKNAAAKVVDKVRDAVKGRG